LVGEVLGQTLHDGTTTNQRVLGIGQLLTILLQKAFGTTTTERSWRMRKYINN
jgi:hypothetical protein